MDAEFWRQKWEKNEIGFHQSEVSPFLLKYFEQLKAPNAGRVFLPLCGKTKDYFFHSCPAAKRSLAITSPESVDRVVRRHLESNPNEC